MNFLANQGKWVTRPLIEVATLKRGYDLPVQDRFDGPHPIFAANGAVGFHVNAKCRGPGVVTGRSGTIGKVHFVEGDFWPLNTSLYVTEFHGNDPKWVYYMLQSFGLERFSQGAGVPTLNRNLIHGEPIPVPTVPEQRRIAAILDQADALRVKRREALAQLDSLTQSIFIEMFGDPVTNPKKLRVATLSECAETIQIGPFGTQLHEEDYVDGGVPLVNPTHIKAGKICPDWSLTVSQEKYKELSNYFLDEGDLILGRRGEMGRCAVVTSKEKGWLCGTGSLFVRPKAKTLHPIFLALVISSPSMRRHLENVAQGVTMANLNKTIVGSLPIPLPPIHDQLKMVSQLDAIEGIGAVSRQSFTELDILFASLQHHAFQGDL